ncbi:glycosyltransferase family 2 protein [Rhodococcus sp. Z13]|uniref:Glycosyltransferase family 2 protein n=1 Tax=Rhodococcus sacchari TaxID=2962047 RepID=A0ACD4DMW0_9NOCA|nr:glycosyltransferase family 2 protein [Rhodococcus sp. Z13]UYP21028.1 glycosyltransferase family 2 protein [Rhodococcus sp. Z13]
MNLPRRAVRRLVVTGAGIAGYGAAVAAANRIALPRLTPGAVVDEPVTVVVPARDEAERIGAVVSDLAAQRGLARLRVLVLDDDSSDGTAEVARRAAGADERITVIRRTDPPPPGWTGKAAACAAAIDRAGAAAATGTVVFVDADVRLAPDALAAAVTLLRRADAGLVSPFPCQETGSVLERLVQPLLFWSWFALLPVAVAHRARRPSMAVACGQFLVFDAAAYTAIGGHAAVAASPTEDLDLARALRRAGFHTLAAAAGPLASCRMYDGPRPLVAGYTRWLWSAFGSPAGAAAVVALYLLAYLVPPSAAVLARGPVRRWGLAGTGAAVASRLLARATERGRPAWSDLPAAGTHPASVLAFASLTAESIRARRAGRTAWKDRRLP